MVAHRVLVRSTLLAVVVALVTVGGGTSLADASAAKRHGVAIAAKADIGAPGKLRIVVRASRAHTRVALRVDGRRRWKVRVGNGTFRRVAHVRVRSGSVWHRVTVRARHRTGRLTTATRVVRVGAAQSSRPVKESPAQAGPKNTREPKDSQQETVDEPADTSPEAEQMAPDSAEPAPAPAPDSQPAPAPLLDAGFEMGFLGWNMAGLGEVEPAVVSDLVRSESKAARFALTGSQSRSELILGGDGGRSTTGMVSFQEGDERFYGFSFLIRSMVYGRPGAHNLLMQFKSDGTGSPNFGLMLWDYQGKRGLWTHSEAMGGDRFLREVAHDRWHDVVVHFKASRSGQGFYRLYLNDELIDARDGVSMIRPDRSYAYIKNGLYRNGGAIPGTSDIRLDAARLGTTHEQARPN